MHLAPPIKSGARLSLRLALAPFVFAEDAELVDSPCPSRTPGRFLFLGKRGVPVERRKGELRPGIRLAVVPSPMAPPGAHFAIRRPLRFGFQPLALPADILGGGASGLEPFGLPPCVFAQEDAAEFGEGDASVGAVPMLPALALELRRHRRAQASRNLALVHRDALVFTTATGKPQNQRNALRAVQEAGDRAKLNGDERPPVGLHDLRHSFVALALASGLTLPEASALARHANPRITAMAYAVLSYESRSTLAAKLAQAFRG